MHQPALPQQETPHPPEPTLAVQLEHLKSSVDEVKKAAEKAAEQKKRRLAFWGFRWF